MDVQTVDPGLNAEIQSALQATLQMLLDAHSEGPDSLVTFTRTWSGLRDQIDAGKASSSLDELTLSLAHSVAMQVSAISGAFLDIENATSTLHDSLSSEMEAILDKHLTSLEHSSPNDPALSLPSRCLPKPSLQPNRHPTWTPITAALANIPPFGNSSGIEFVTKSTHPASDPNSMPEFIEHAYKFFVANIFNPYPTREQKEAIVRQTNHEHATIFSISNWFINARRRCGWLDILKRRCNGNRNKMVDLAKRVFVKPDPCRPVHPQVMTELMEMKEKVESMYERKTRISSWVEELEGMKELKIRISPWIAELEDLIHSTRYEEQMAEKGQIETERCKYGMCVGDINIIE